MRSDWPNPSWETYNMIRVYRINVHTTVPAQLVDTYRGLTIEGALSEYEADYLHDEASGTFLMFVDTDGQVITTRRVEVKRTLVLT